MSQANVYEQYMLELINADRASAGAQPLAFDGDLNESAEGHSAWMSATDTFSHTGSGGSTGSIHIRSYMSLLHPLCPGSSRLPALKG